MTAHDAPTHRYATQTDVYALYASLLVPPFSQPALPPRPIHTTAHVTRRTSTTKYLRSRDQIAAELGKQLLAFREMPEVFREALGEEGYIVRVDWAGETAEEEREAVRKVARWIQEHA